MEREDRYDNIEEVVGQLAIALLTILDNLEVATRSETPVEEAATARKRAQELILFLKNMAAESEDADTQQLSLPFSSSERRYLS